MRVFISWSGNRSHQTAEALFHFLPLVFQSVCPWMSTQDLHAGVRWGHELAKALNEIEFGIVCVTRENLKSTWLAFEAGALSKSVAESRVVPYVLGLPISELSGPLAQFQSVTANREGTLALLNSMAAVNPANVASPDRTKRVFDAFWPEFEQLLKAIDHL